VLLRRLGGRKTAEYWRKKGEAPFSRGKGKGDNLFFYLFEGGGKKEGRGRNVRANYKEVKKKKGDIPFSRGREKGREKSGVCHSSMKRKSARHNWGERGRPTFLLILRGKKGKEEGRKAPSSLMRGLKKRKKKRERKNKNGGGGKEQEPLSPREGKKEGKKGKQRGKEKTSRRQLRLEKKKKIHFLPRSEKGKKREKGGPLAGEEGRNATKKPALLARAGKRRPPTGRGKTHLESSLPRKENRSPLP